MKKRAPTTLAQKLLLGLFGAILAVVVVTHVVMWRGLSRFSLEHTQAELGRDVRMLRDIIQDPQTPPSPTPTLVAPTPDTDKPLAPQMQARIRRLASDLALRVTLIDARGEVIFDTEIADGAPMPASHADRPERLQALDRGEGSDERDSDTLHIPMLYVAVPLYPGTDRKDVIRVSRDLSQLDDSMRRMRDLLYWLASGTLLGALVFSYMMSRLLARPLHAFTRVVREVVRGQSQPEALSQTASTAQLLLLADAISTLIAELERVRKRVRRDSTQLAALLDAIDLPVIFVNPAGQIIRVNTAAHSQLDLPHTTTHLDDAGLSGLRSVIDAALSAEGPMSTHIVRTSEEPGVEPQRWLASVVPIAAHGSQQGVVLVLRRPADSHPAPLTRRSVAHMKAIPRPDPSRDPSPTGERWG